MKVWLNGKILDEVGANISIFDRGFLYGDGVFESLRSYNGIPFRLKEHLARLKSSLEVVRIRIRYRRSEIKDAISNLLKINSLKDAYIRVMITRGVGLSGIDIPFRSVPTCAIIAREFKPYPKKIYMKGVKARVVKIKTNEYSTVSSIKSISLLNNILARCEAKVSGYDEAIIENTRGYVAEGASSNIFMAKNSVLYTPSLDCGILPGITRALVIEIANRLKIKVIEGRLKYHRFLSADEVFLTNSLAEIIPVTNINGHKIGEGEIGPLTSMLSKEYRKVVKRECGE